MDIKIAELVNNNMCLVDVQANKMYYVLKGTSADMDIEDLKQEGTIALVKAAESFNESKGMKFSSYATNIIKQAIKRAICKQARLVRIPENQFDEYAKIQQAIYEYKMQYLGTQPDLRIIGMRLEMSEGKILSVINAVEGGRNILSLNEPISEDDSADSDEKISFIKDENIDIERALEIKEEKRIIQSLVKNLNQNELFVITHRFGLDGDEPKTLAEIGKLKGYSRETIRLIEKRALMKLKSQISQETLEELLAV